MSAYPEVAVVVGATGAMGQAIVRTLAKTGLRVIGVARTAEAVTRLGRDVSGLEPCVCDIASDASIQTIREAVGNRAVRMVVHGPGVSTAGGVLTAPIQAVVDAGGEPASVKRASEVQARADAAPSR